MSKSRGTRITKIIAMIIDNGIAFLFIGFTGGGVGMLVATALFYPSREMTFSWWVVMGFIALVTLVLFIAGDQISLLRNLLGTQPRNRYWLPTSMFKRSCNEYIS